MRCSDNADAAGLSPKHSLFVLKPQSRECDTLVLSTETMSPGARCLRDAAALPPQREHAIWRCTIFISPTARPSWTVGSDLPDLAAVRRAAIAMTTDVLGGIKAGPAFWSGEPWKLWVTDRPNGAGETLLTLQFAAIAGDVRAHDNEAAQL